MDSGQADNIFLGILQNCGQIEPFLDIIFSFLARRTDFFRIMHNKDDKMGFPEGVAEKMVLKIFHKYQRLILGRANAESKEKKTIKTRKEKMMEKTIPPQDTCQSEPSSVEEPQQQETKKSESSPEKMDEASSIVTSTVEVTSSDTNQHINEQPCSSKDEDAEPEPSTPSSLESTSSKDTAESESTESESKLLEPGKLPDCYNGAVLDKYTWSQTIKDIDLKVPVPKCVQRARDLTVEIRSSSLKVALRGNIPPEELTTGSNILIDGELQRTVRCEESMWSLEPGKCVQINLEKTEERFWTAVCKGDPEIDRTKVDSTRNIEDFDEQTQTDFQQVMYDHQQKIMGKPTSKEQKTHDILKKAWNAKGSPFAGTPFDPSQVNISG